MIICSQCGVEIVGKISAVKHLMADHGYGLTEANAELARVLLGADSLRSR
jgi:hypothetical protein